MTTAASRCRLPAVALALPAVVTTVALVAVTRKGAYTSPDSAFYAGLAHSLIDGHGFRAPPGSPPLAHFPPLFGLALAGPGRLLGADPLDVAAVLNPLVVGLVVLLVGFVVRRRSGSVGVAVAASVLVTSGLDLLVYGASALSEPLFLLLALSAVVVLAEAITRRSDALLAGAALLAAAACLTRFLGLALVVAGIIAVLRFEGSAGRRRAAAYAAVSLVAPAGWFLLAGHSDRMVALHGFTLRYWTSGLSDVSRWVLPHFVPWPVRVVALVAVAAALGRLTGRRPPAGAARVGGGDPFPFVVGSFAVSYFVLLVAYRVVLDQTARLDARFLGPLHVAAVIVVVPLLHRACKGPHRWVDGTVARRALVVGMAAIALHCGQAAVWAARGLVDDSVGRRGLAGRSWRDSTVLTLVAGLRPEVPVYTNAADAVFLLTGRRTEPIPVERDHLSGVSNRTYTAELEAMREGVERRGAVVVYALALHDRRDFRTTLAEVRRSTSLEEVGADKVAVAYRLGRP